MSSKQFEPLTAEQAKEKVFEHWTHLDKLANRKFPDQEDLAFQARSYTQNKLESNEWQRVRAWEGKGLFLPFLIKIASNLLIDYRRKQSGHPRPPQWILNKKDKLWKQAHKLLFIKMYERQETKELLRSIAPDRPIDELEQMVSEILSKCRQPPSHKNTVSIDECEELISPENDPSKFQEFNRNEVIEILSRYIVEKENQVLPQHLQNAIKHFRSQLSLNEEDRMFLYLHYIEGLNIKVIAKRLHLNVGSAYKRHTSLIESLREACKQTELMFDLEDDIDESR